MHDLSNVSYDEAVTKLAAWYRQKQASIGEGVGRLGEWIGNNPGTAATIGGGALGGVIGGATEGPDGWRGRVRRSLTGAVAGAGIGGGGALAAKSLLGGHPAAAGAPGTEFNVGGKKMQFDPKAIANDPTLSEELHSINSPTAYSAASSGIKGIVGTGLDYAPATTIGAPLLAAGQLGYGRATTLSPTQGHDVKDLAGSSAGWGKDLADAATAQAKNLKTTGVTPAGMPQITPGIRRDAVNSMFDRAMKDGEKGVTLRKNPFTGSQHLGTAGRTRFNRLAGLAALPAIDIGRLLYKGWSDDSEKKQKLLDLVRQHAKPVQG